MGRIIKTNIKKANIHDFPYDGEILRSLAKTNPLLILDNIPGKYHYPLFDGYYFEKNKEPLIVEAQWQMGAGQVVDFSFIVSSVNHYLPTIVINGILGNLSFELAKKVFKIFKSKISNKRQIVAYYSEDEKLSYFEFSSDTSTTEFSEGLNEIPRVSEKVKSGSYFIRNKKKWILEDKT